MASRRRSSPRAIIFSGVSAILNRERVALFTPASVACAESTTATRRVYGLWYSSSLFGSGLAAANRRKISRMASGFSFALGLRRAGLGFARRAAENFALASMVIR